jgi:hypothetical protein
MTDICRSQKAILAVLSGVINSSHLRPRIVTEEREPLRQSPSVLDDLGLPGSFATQN